MAWLNLVLPLLVPRGPVDWAWQTQCGVYVCVTESKYKCVCFCHCAHSRAVTLICILRGSPVLGAKSRRTFSIHPDESRPIRSKTHLEVGLWQQRKLPTANLYNYNLVIQCYSESLFVNWSSEGCASTLTPPKFSCCGIKYSVTVFGIILKELKNIKKKICVMLSPNKKVMF